jgi:hypothetical protein
MKTIFLSITIASLISSCATCRIQKNLQDDELIGVIQLGNSECPVVISTKENGEAKGYYPVNMDDSLKVDNVDEKKIIFTYAPSRAPQPAGCDVDMTITLLTTRWTK